MLDFSTMNIYILFTDPQIPLFNNFFIKNRSHDTIHTFKNYFATVFSVFNFSKISPIQTDTGINQELEGEHFSNTSNKATKQKVTSLLSILLRLLLFRKDTLVQIVYSHRTPIPTHSPFHQKDN